MKRRTWPQRVVLAAGALSSVALLGSAAGIAYLYNKAEQIPRVELSRVLDTTEESGGPENYLIVGVDSAERTIADDPIREGRDGEQNTDTIMVLRIDPSSQEASILSMPRDLWVPYPDGSYGRINASMLKGNGKPDVLISVLNSYLGVPIHHYVQVDFAGFFGLVDAIDGVPVYFPNPARDTHSGLLVDGPACVTLDPEQALAYVRSRYYEEMVAPDVWQQDPRSDLGRISRQQDFIRRAMDRAISKGARNPGTLDRLLDTAVGSVAMDDGLTIGAVFDLANRFRSFSPGQLKSNVVPGTPDNVGGAEVLRLNAAEAEPILAAFRGAPPPPPPAPDAAAAGAPAAAEPPPSRPSVPPETVPPAPQAPC